MNPKRQFNRILQMLMLIYVPLMILSLVAGTYSHFLAGILVLLVVIFKDGFMKKMRGSGYRGYILFVVGFDVVWETAFYVGGYRMLPTGSYFEIIVVNVVGWFFLGTAFYALAVKLDYSSMKALVVPAVLGILMENLFRLGTYPPEVSLALIFMNAVNYSVELGFAYFFVKGYRRGKATFLSYVAGVILLWVVWYVLYSLVAPIYLGLRAEWPLTFEA